LLDVTAALGSAAASGAAVSGASHMARGSVNTRRSLTCTGCPALLVVSISSTGRAGGKEQGTPEVQGAAWFKQEKHNCLWLLPHQTRALLEKQRTLRDQRASIRANCPWKQVHSTANRGAQAHVKGPGTAVMLPNTSYKVLSDLSAKH
jgi:hypothetical protein